jgi:outer membrane protein TolC
VHAGTAVEADRLRAAADAATARQVLVESRTDVALASRDLEVLSGLVPSAEEQVLDDTLPDERPLEFWLTNVERLPQVRAAGSEARSAAWQQRARALELLPSIVLVLEERRTNAIGFGAASAWSVGLSARWEVGFASAAVRSTAATRQALEGARAEQARSAGETEILRAWHGVNVQLERVRAARLNEIAYRAAAELERLRFRAGVATVRQRSEAELDLMRAAATRIGAEADLAAARVILRLRGGLETGQ